MRQTTLQQPVTHLSWKCIWPSLAHGTFAAAMGGGASRHLPYSRLMMTVQGFYEPLFTENTLRMGEQTETAIGGYKIKTRSSLSERRISADANAYPTHECLQYRSSTSLISGILFLRANGASGQSAPHTSFQEFRAAQYNLCRRSPRIARKPDHTRWLCRPAIAYLKKE